MINFDRFVAKICFDNLFVVKIDDIAVTNKLFSDYFEIDKTLKIEFAKTVTTAA